MADQIAQVAAYIDKNLESLGIESRRLEELDLSNEDVATVITAFYKVLVKSRDANDQHEALTQSFSRAQDDVATLRQNQTLLQEELIKKDREMAVMEETQRQFGLTEKKLNDQVRKLKEEGRKLRLEKQHLSTNYSHFKKRQETEHTKLKERLQKLLNDKNNERKLGMKALNLIQRKGGARGQWANASKADEELHRIIVVNYEDRLKEATLENKDLRESLKLMESELMQVVNDVEQQSEVSVAKENPVSTVTASPLKPGHFELPFAASRSGIQQSLKHTMTNLRSRISDLHRSAKPGTSDTREILELQSKLEECGRIIEQQRAALFEDSSLSPSKSFLSDSIVHERAGNLQQERKDLDEERAHMHHERELFLEAATKLDLDRARILAAKIQIPPTPKAGTTLRQSATPRVQFSQAPNSVSTPMATSHSNVDLARYLQMDSTPL
eukprot:m.58213 g.58213  ORF g.58213 m.58213 type:complete len:443 (-) comp22517_c0_seq1:190-1518(-)